MRKPASIIALAIFLTPFLAACTPPGAALEPIPGSITYQGQPRTRLVKSPVGSTVHHDFRMSDGRIAFETYRIEEDRSLTLLSRQIISDLPEN